MEVKKFTNGCVEQIFDNGQCVSQKFIAVNGVEYEDSFGNVLPTEKMNAFIRSGAYQPFDMVQPEPGFDYYILKLIGLVEPLLIGPLTKDECEKQLSAFGNDHGEVENSHTEIKVTKGAEIDI